MAKRDPNTCPEPKFMLAIPSTARTLDLDQATALSHAKASARVFIDRQTQETFNRLIVDLRHLMSVKVFN